MANESKTQERPRTQQLPPEAQSAGAIDVYKPRIPYRARVGHKYGVDEGKWMVLINAIFPSAKTADGVELAIDYCISRNLDIMKRPVHIVPMNTKIGNQWITIETIWPGISELRTTAFRTGKYAGCDPAEFGPDKTHKWEIQARQDDSGDDHPNAPPSEKKAAAPKVINTVECTFPEWCQITVYRIIGDQRIAFPGPRVYWLETYATASRFNDAPNEMWKDRTRGQLEKCAEAAALRKAFPEELGGEYTIDEAPRMVDITPGAKTEDDVPATRPERDDPKPQSGVKDTPAARAARAKQQATTVEPETSSQKAETTTEAAKASNDPPHDDQTGEVEDDDTPEMSAALEDALAKLARCNDPAEIDGARPYLKKDLTPDDFAVWQRASLETQQRLSKQKR